MSAETSRHPKTERKYTSIACQNCRKRKGKCDNAKPRCSNCRLYNVDCVFGEDRRRASSLHRTSTSSLVKQDDETTGTGINTATTYYNGPIDSWPSYPGAGLQQQFQNVSNYADYGNGAMGFMDPNMVPSGGPQEWEYSMPTYGNNNFIAPPDSSLNARGFPPVPSLQHYTSDPLPNASYPYSMSPQASSTTPSSATLNHSYQAPGDFRQPSELGGTSTIYSGTPQTTSFSPPQSSLKDFHHTSPEGCRESSSEPQRKVDKVRSHDESNAADDGLDDITRQLTSRMGKLQIAQDGQPRYFGATSNLHILQGVRSFAPITFRSVAIDGEKAIEQAGLNCTLDPAYEEHLIRLFFCWHNVLMYVVDEAIFWRERQKWKAGQQTDLYSPALANAIFTIGSSYADRPHEGVPDDAPDEFFGLRTKVYLDIEIDSPTVATAQALLVVSALEAAHMRDSRGWIYSGMAVQIMTDLGLHLDLEAEYYQLDPRSDQEVAILRRNLFWAANTIDALWSSYSGRPSLMKSLEHNVQGPCPSPTYRWEYYVDEYSRMDFPPDMNMASAASVHVYLSGLCDMMRKISEVLYSGLPEKHLPGLADNVQKALEMFDNNLKDWLETLPEPLRVDTNDTQKTLYIPSILELHLQYCEAVIFLHRPFISKTDTPSSSPQSYQTIDSFDRCIQSAREICRLLILFRRRYGLRRPHHQMTKVTMTASLIHVFRSCTTASGSSEAKEAQQDLMTCIQALGEMSQTYPSASRALEVITSLRQSWQGVQGDVFGYDRGKRARMH